MSDYPQGSIKYDPESGSVAIRTNQPLESGNPIIPSQAWLIATQTSGAHFGSAAVVETWADVEVSGGS